jgi:hypothetical protein
MLNKAWSQFVVMGRSALVALALSSASPVSAQDQAAAAKATASSETPSSAAEEKRAGFDLLASIAYAYTTTEPNGLKLDPYGGYFGLDLGYTWNMGLRVGARASYGLGRSIKQTYDPLIGASVDLTSDAQSVTASATVGYDMKLHILTLRYALGIGFTSLHWDLGDIPYTSFAGYSPMKGSMFGAQIDPGVALLWQRGHFECGLGLHYLVPFTEEVPSALVAELLVGTRL